ncbi:hypothetical protein LV779_35890 [Streptomyces thinghirensis]|nr:hypothetical protein [Streptomyces thinghirensis]
MPQFQVGEVPSGFTFTENETFIDCEERPPARRAEGQPGRRLGRSLAEPRLPAGQTRSSALATTPTPAGARATWDVKHDGPRVWNQLPATTLKIAIGRQKRDAADAADDVPVGWLLEYSDM